MTAYEKDSLSLTGTIAMGTGVMIGAGIFALTGQVAELAGVLFPLAFLLAALISAASAYSYIKVSNKYPSAGGIAMVLNRAYGATTATGGAALLMAFSMIINESLVARTFGTYALRPFDAGNSDLLVPLLALGLVAFGFLINIAGNEAIGRISTVAAVLKIGGILVFALVALSVAGVSFAPASGDGGGEASAGGFLAGVALAILAYKGFTTITNSGDEVRDPKKNVGRAIMISLGICTVAYLLVAYAVGSSLSIDEVISTRDYSLAEAARPAVGDAGVAFTVGIAIVATASGIMASMFAVSRMLAMLTEMKIIPHRHFGMPGGIQKHTLVYTVVAAGALAAFFDLGRIASLGAIFYLVMDMMIHWGIFRYLRKDVGAHPAILLSALALDAVALVAFVALKIDRDPLIIGIAAGAMATIFLLEKLYVEFAADADDDEGEHAESGHSMH